MKTFNQFITEANSICNKTGKGEKCPMHGIMICPGYKKYDPNKPHPGNIPEENLHKWFQSRAKDGTPGWVQVVSGKPCARQPGQKSTPKCVSSEKRASMSSAERTSAQERKRRLDPNQPQKTGAAKPTYVSTDKPQNSIKEDACKEKVKSRYKVWPSAYASGAVVKCRKVGAANWGNKSKKIDEAYTRIQERGTTYSIILNWRGKVLISQMFFPQFTRPTKGEVVREIRKVYPNAIVLSYNPTRNDPTKPLLFAGAVDGPGKN